MLIDLPSTRPVFAYAQDYLHGERVELHRHSRAQLIHALSGVVTVGTAEGTWVVPTVTTPLSAWINCARECRCSSTRSPWR